MQQEKYDNYFSRINYFYQQYIDVVSKKGEVDFTKKWATAYKTIRDKIILTVCKVYFEYEIKEDASDSIPAVDTKNRYDDNYSDIVVEETIKALESYEESLSKKNGYGFSYYVCMNIRQEVGKARSKDYISVNHGGAVITDYEAIQTRKVIKKDKELEKLGIFDEEKRNQKLSLLLGIRIGTVKKYKVLGKNRTCSTEIEKEGKTYSVLDLENNLQGKNFVTPESEYISNELQEQLPLLLNDMESLFLKKGDEKTSKLLAISILEHFEALKKIHIKDGHQMSDFYPILYKMLSKYSCINSEIMRNFFTDPDYVLPSQKNITDSYGLERSAATHILSRFREKLSEKENVKKYFKTFSKNVVNFFN